MVITHGKQTITELRQEMTRIRRLGGRVNTNYFNQCSRCADALPCWVGESALAFGWMDNGVPRIYFYAVDDEELTQLLAMTPNGSCIDFITKDRDANRELFIEAGYELYAEYARAVTKQKSEKAKEIDEVLNSNEKIREELHKSNLAEAAKIEDAEELDACLRAKFNAYDSHFYDLDTLREYIRKGWVYVARENGKIIAATMFEIQGRKMYSAFTFNNGPVEAALAVGDAASAACSKYGCTHFYCWMDMNNKRAVRYNIEYCGNELDGIYDMIYTKGVEKPKGKTRKRN